MCRRGKTCRPGASTRLERPPRHGSGPGALRRGWRGAGSCRTGSRLGVVAEGTVRSLQRLPAPATVGRGVPCLAPRSARRTGQPLDRTRRRRAGRCRRDPGPARRATCLPEDRHGWPKALARADPIGIDNLRDGPATVARADADAGVRFETRAPGGDPQCARRRCSTSSIAPVDAGGAGRRASATRRAPALPGVARRRLPTSCDRPVRRTAQITADRRVPATNP